MKEEHKPIQELLDRFFEGLTTNQEERELYLFFKQDVIPEELVRYKPVINYFESGIAEEWGQTVNPSHNSKRRQWMVWGSVAASFLLLLFTSLYLLTNKESSDPFEGSYIIRNGVRITDLNLIRPELEATIQKVVMQQKETDQLIEERLLGVDHTMEDQIIRQMHEHYKRILDNIRDEEIRNEVAKILYTNY